MGRVSTTECTYLPTYFDSRDVFGQMSTTFCGH